MRLSKIVRNSIVGIVAHTGLAWLCRKKMSAQGPLVRVVVFHDVTDADWFASIIAHLDTTYRIISPHDFLDAKYDPKKINILITFDDGYDSWERVAHPILARRNIKALFFANSGLLDVYETASLQSHYVRTHLLLNPRKTLSWEGLQKLHIEGHMIGGHTTTHARLAKLQKDMQRVEIEGDRKRIEAMLGCAPAVFAYPFGRSVDFTRETKDIVHETGYTAAFTTMSGFADPTHADPYAIPRLCIENDLSILQLDHWMKGGYDVYAYLKRICAR